MRNVVALVLMAVVLGCEPPPTSIPPGGAPTIAPPVQEQPVPPPPPKSEPVAEPVGDPVAEPVSGSTTASEPALRALGARCTSNADCESGLCEGEGCGPDQGRCTSKARACTRDRRAYCGCSGQTFYSSGNCPGQRFAHRGECTAGGGASAGGAATPAPDGARCATGADCQSGICEGEGCGPDQPGVCRSRQRRCTMDLQPYCGCDGKTFRTSGSCPGARFQYRGECRS